VRNVDVLAKIADGLGLPRRVFRLVDDAPAGPVTLRIEITRRSRPRRTAPLVLRSDPRPPDQVRRNEQWTGHELRLLREATRREVAELAHRLGVPTSRCIAWEAAGPAAVPDPAVQTALDVELQAASADDRQRFLAALAHRPPVLFAPVVTLSPHLTPGELFIWTGREVRLLRQALRWTLQEFADHLGISVRMVAAWEAGGAGMRPRPVNQAVLDTCLRRADPEARERFCAAMVPRTPPA
jgi:DNA-binding transcriptional regulator YiaG